MNAIIRAMERRRSIRNFLPELPDREKLDLIAESGLYAASGMGQLLDSSRPQCIRTGRI